MLYVLSVLPYCWQRGSDSLVTAVPVQSVQKRAQWSVNIVLGREVVTLFDAILIGIQDGSLLPEPIRM